MLAAAQSQPRSDTFSPERIRALRGGKSRATFARGLGVTAQTVYRWELALDAAQSRRPRGEPLQRLRVLERGGDPTSLAPSSAPPAAAATSSAPPPPARAIEEDVALVLPAFERGLDGALQRSHAELVHIIATRRELSPDARSLARAGIAMLEMMLRADGRAALLVIAPALEDAEAGALSPQIEARVLAVAATVHATADASLFDLGRVHAYAARVELLAARRDQVAISVACLARLYAAILVGDGELVERAYARLDDAAPEGLPDMLDLLVEEFIALRPVISGKATSTSCMRAFEGLCARAEQRGYPVALARLLCHTAKASLETLAEPGAALVLARKAKRLCHGSRMVSGMHTIFALRVEMEALLRVGQISAAFEVVSELELVWSETGVPPMSAFGSYTRLLFLTGRHRELTDLAARIAQCEVPALRPIARAHSAFVEATALLSRCKDAARCVVAFEQAEREARGWPLLLRDVQRNCMVAHLVAGDLDEARRVLRRAQAASDAYPSSWGEAHLRRLEALLLAASGRWEYGRTLLDSAAATFDLAKDVADAALCRFLSASLDHQLGGAPQQAVDDAQSVLDQLGVAPPRALGATLRALHVRSRASDALSEGGPDVRALIVPVQRLTVRGAVPAMILRELMSILAELLPARSARLEQIDAAGAPHWLAGDADAHAPREWHEFTDGAGRSLRLGLSGEPSDGERAVLSILVGTSALALDAAQLRGAVPVGEPAPGEDGDVGPLARLIGASRAMRNLRSQIARLSRSRATVIVTGESGTGKELVARAIHDASERAQKDYVAFNCASVPRELFEGQLFGYRRGAFTGATSDHPGVIRAANLGTLFLDEIAELPLDLQPKLLRFLENAEVFPLGERSPVRVDVRVIAATHRNLAQLVREGQFREDLYYRLQVVPLHVEPLRERSEDIPMLARYFVRTLSREPQPPVFAPDALAALGAHAWPGNVRELRNVIERALAFSPVPALLRAEHLQLL